MDKKCLFKILAKSDIDTICKLSDEIQQENKVTIIKKPSKTLTMIKLREPVKESLFYLGEVIVCESIVEIDGIKGMAVTMGDDLDKVLHMAIIDAAINKGIFKRMDTLMKLSKKQEDLTERENAMHLKTMVNFESMDMEAPTDVAAFRKA